MISVIVPIYKVEDYLDRCIESIVKQKYRNLEIILVDDGSPDQCGAICERWAAKDGRIKVIHKKNAGLAAARNTGIEESSGEYLCFIDSDDFLEPKMLEKLLKALIMEEAEVAACNFVYEYEDPEKKTEKKFPESYQIHSTRILNGREFMALMDQGKYAFCEIACNKLYKRELFAELRYPEGKIHEDEFVFHHLFYPCGRIVCIPTVGYHYFQRKGSITSSGKHLYNYTEAFIDRCRYLTDSNDMELALVNEGRLLAGIKKLQHIKKRKERKNLENEYFRIIRTMYQKGWISIWTVWKRLIRCRIL